MYKQIQVICFFLSAHRKLNEHTFFPFFKFTVNFEGNQTFFVMKYYIVHNFLGKNKLKSYLLPGSWYFLA